MSRSDEENRIRLAKAEEQMARQSRRIEELERDKLANTIKDELNLRREEGIVFKFERSSTGSCR